MSIREKRRNCNTCKKNWFVLCEVLESNEEYKEAIKDDEYSLFGENGYDFKENFICDEYKSRYIEYPIEVSKINSSEKISKVHDRRIGKFVKIRPCAEKYKNKTYLGLYLGDLPIGHSISHNPETKELNINFRSNPGIFVFDLNKIIYGCESWWGIIESEEDLKNIDDNDIDNVWYVKALESIK